MDWEEFLGQPPLKRERHLIDPTKIFTTPLALANHTRNEQYISHEGQIWRVESLDGSTAQLCELTMNELTEIAKLVDFARSRLPAEEPRTMFSSSEN